MKARNKGNGFERDIRKELMEYLYPSCQTSRYGSKYADDMKVDFINTGFLNIQAKAWERAPNFHEVLDSMPDDEKFNVVFHKRNRKGTVVVLSKEDFYEILRIMKSNGIKI